MGSNLQENNQVILFTTSLEVSFIRLRLEAMLNTARSKLGQTLIDYHPGTGHYIRPGTSLCNSIETLSPQATMSTLADTATVDDK